MKASSSGGAAFVVVFLLALAVEMGTVSAFYKGNYNFCPIGTPCRGRLIRCPAECPFFVPWHPHGKYCFINCNSPKCEAVCKGKCIRYTHP